VKATDSTGTRRLIWDGLNVTHELDGGGALARRYTHGYSPIEGVRQLLDVQNLDEAGDPHRFYVFDLPGAVRKLTDAAGDVMWRADYEPFGRVITRDDVTVPRFTYPATYEASPDVPLRYSPTRPFDPEGGRFGSRDSAYPTPVYSAFAGNPLSMTDPSGQLQFEGVNSEGPVVGEDPKGEVPGAAIWWGIWAKPTEADARSLREAGRGFLLIERHQRGYAVDCRGELTPWRLDTFAGAVALRITQDGVFQDKMATPDRQGEGPNPGNLAYLKYCSIGIAPWGGRIADRKPHPLHCTEGFLAFECRVSLYTGEGKWTPARERQFGKDIRDLSSWLHEGRGERRAEAHPSLQGFAKLGGETFTAIWRWNYCVTPGSQSVYSSPRLRRGPNRAGR
jgi:hypothetical protein